MNKARLKQYNNDYILSSSGYEVNTFDDNWKISKNCNLNIAETLKYLNEGLYDGFIKTMTYFVSELSDGYAEHVFHTFNKMINKQVVDYIDESLILNFMARLGKNRLYQFSKLKVMLNKWHSLNFPGIDSKVIKLFNEIKIKKYGYGDVVKMRDPNKGPFNIEELKCISNATEEAYNTGKISIHTYAMLKLLLHSGRRISQLTALKRKDLFNENNIYYLNIPRKKQRGVNKGSYRKVEINESLWDTLNKILDINTEIISDYLGCELKYKNIDKIPLFLSTYSLRNLDRDIDIEHYLENEDLHITTGSMNRAIASLSKKMKLVSPRTGKIIRISSVRFRYTFATMLAKSGESLASIAMSLDHSGTGSVGCYVQNLPDNVIDIDKAISKYLQPISDIFLGKQAYEGDILLNIFVSDIRGCRTEKNVLIKGCTECKHFNSW
jgi:integrase